MSFLSLNNQFPEFSKYFNHNTAKGCIKELASKEKGKKLCKFVEKVVHNQNWKKSEKTEQLLEHTFTSLSKKKVSSKKVSKGSIKKLQNLKEIYKKQKIKKVNKKRTIEDRYLDIIKKATPAKRLYKEALKAHEKNYKAGNSKNPFLKIKLVADKILPFGAQADFHKGKIEVDLSKCDTQENALAFFIFELCNFKRVAQFQQVHFNAISGKYDKETYAMEYERIEFDGTHEHHRIVQACIEEHQWHPLVDIYKHQVQTFDEWWALNKNTSHVDHYRTHFDEIQTSLEAALK
jgi:hypothetical protein